jgi:hypothetical protein
MKKTTELVGCSVTRWSQLYDRELQRHERLEKKYSSLKSALSYYNAGLVVVCKFKNSKDWL